MNVGELKKLLNDFDDDLIISVVADEDCHSATDDVRVKELLCYENFNKGATFLGEHELIWPGRVPRESYKQYKMISRLIFTRD